MPRKQRGGCQNGMGRRKKLHKWAQKGRGKQRGGFLFTGLAVIGSLISAGIAAAAPAVASGAISAAAGYGVTRAIKAMEGKGKPRRKLRSRR
jgi:hypothetical protein